MKLFLVKDLLNNVIAKCKTESRAMTIANSRDYETKVCMTLVKDPETK